MRTTALPPPLKVGTRVRYVGHGFKYGEPGDEVPWVRAGAIGEVVEVHEGLDAHPSLVDEDTGEVLPPNDGWSVVRFDAHNSIAVTQETMAGTVEVTTR